jgi:hypothetical protein
MAASRIEPVAGRLASGCEWRRLPAAALAASRSHGSIALARETARPARRTRSARLSPKLWIGRAVVATAFAVYETGGILSYNEFLIAVRVAAGERGMVHVPRIWVDSPASTAGARALWAVPKQMATFEIFDDSVFSAEAFTGSGPIAGLRFTPRLALPGRWPMRMRIAQQDLRHSNADKLEITRVEASARMMMGSAEWAFPATSPAAFLLGHRPFLSLRLDGMTMAFGV